MDRKIVINSHEGREAGVGALAEAEPIAALGSRDSGRRVHRRRHGESGLNEDQRDMLNIGPYTTFDNISESYARGGRMFAVRSKRTLLIFQ